MIRLLKKRKYLLATLLAAIIGLVFTLLLSVNWMYTTQMRATDLLFRVADSNQEAKLDDKIVMVTIDDASIEHLGHISSWPRTHYASVIDTLAASQTRIIVFDILFSEVSNGDEELANSIKNAANVILPVAYKTPLSNPESAMQKYPQESNIRPLAVFERETLAIGHSNVATDADGVVRRIPVVVGSETEAEPSLALASVAKYLRLPKIVVSPIRENYLSFAGRIIPVNDNNEMLINFTSDPWKAGGINQYQTVSFADLLDKQVDLSQFQDKIVIIGVSASALPDYFWTPTGQRVPGAEIHANAISTILRGNFLMSASNSVTIGIIIALAFICVWMVLYLKTLWSIALTMLTCLIYIIITLVLFDSGVILNMFYPPLVIASSFVGANLYNVVSERYERSEVTRTFGRYVSQPVVDKILTALDKGQLKLGGESREITTMFADVRNFTGISESNQPKELLRILNIYLSIIIKAILKYNGMVNKFGGDSIMAIWNAPVEHENGALSAIEAALFALHEIDDLKKKDASIINMEFGFGINTGGAVAGNIGSEARLEYSVIGDSVNTAARIAGSAPGGRLWIGGNTYRKVQNCVNALALKPLLVKGKSEPVEVYEIIAP